MNYLSKKTILAAFAIIGLVGAGTLFQSCGSSSSNNSSGSSSDTATTSTTPAAVDAESNVN